MPVPPQYVEERVVAATLIPGLTHPDGSRTAGVVAEVSTQVPRRGVPTYHVIVTSLDAPISVGHDYDADAFLSAAKWFDVTKEWLHPEDYAQALARRVA